MIYQCAGCHDQFTSDPTFKASITNADGVVLDTQNFCDDCARDMIDPRGNVKVEFKVEAPPKEWKHGRTDT